jgi:hypothetical protein
MKRAMRLKPLAAFILAIIAPFLMELIIYPIEEYLNRLIYGIPFSLSSLIYHGIIVGPSYCLLALADASRASRLIFAIIFTLLLIIIIPALMYSTIWASCYFFNRCP